ncbi:protein of unknown function [Cupriavidus taiwanensis]|uniref:Uncharacterized protein n=1 Tax=Cupriavidus taiwanensis TaxID=164546 RepID=A0A7Z7JCI6_9BURK|nr:protein of unknown function [Cupriavidus taiwanensis]SOZ03341.1 hypothetical protein CBM2597_A120071 [Cupriavidus taiwanensis]SPC20140.1 hypothetical protein CBM2594_A90073 [Cupriavidus taiwanensis]
MPHDFTNAPAQTGQRGERVTEPSFAGGLCLSDPGSTAGLPACWWRAPSARAARPAPPWRRTPQPLLPYPSKASPPTPSCWASRPR